MQTIFKRLNNMYLVLLVGQALFCLTVVFLQIGEPETRVVLAAYKEGPDTYERLLLMLGLPLMGAAWLLSRKRAQEGAMMEGLQAKLAHYRQTVTLRITLIEIVNVMALVIALLAGDMSYLLYFAVGLFVFLMFRPSTGGFIRHYELSPQEAAELKTIGA
ncbi:MAG: hypothetical protein IPN33_06685 [Saprospiraceae bacterium]|nr:hypothetical protein [Saprospiraceae bacterium]